MMGRGAPGKGGAMNIYLGALLIAAGALLVVVARLAALRRR